MARTTHREKSPTGHLPSERSEQLGRRLAIAIESRNWDRCQDIIRQAQDEIGIVANPLDLAVAELPVNMRIANGLEEMGVLMVRDLVELTPAEILNYPNFGLRCLREIQRALRQVGLGESQEYLLPFGDTRD